MNIRLPRHDDVDLEFEGECLVNMSSFVQGQSRWTEIRIYKTNKGAWVTEVVGRTTVPGENDRFNVAVHRKPEHVRFGLMRRQGGERYITDMGRKALAKAAQVDPALQVTLTERI